MYYTIQHITRFRYSAPIVESVMEVRMQPRSDGIQRCLSFKLAVEPTTRVSVYRDYLGNYIHHFDIPGSHIYLTLTAESIVEQRPAPRIPDALAPDSWDALDSAVQHGDFWDWLMPSQFAHTTPELALLAQELAIQHRRDDPLSLLRHINQAIYNGFGYEKNSTRVDSPIDDALTKRKGVCQDFTHIMIALARELAIPARYVSGYLFHRPGGYDRSEGNDASHAWVEAYLPGFGWVGFDPTNNLIVGERHIRVAVGRDYADSPPTQGVFKGGATTEVLDVSVKVERVDELPPDDFLFPPANLPPVIPDADERRTVQQQQQQQ